MMKYTQKNLLPVLLKTARWKKRKQEVGDDLGISVLNLLSEASFLPSLAAINLVKVKI